MPLNPAPAPVRNITRVLREQRPSGARGFGLLYALMLFAVVMTMLATMAYQVPAAVLVNARGFQSATTLRLVDQHARRLAGAGNDPRTYLHPATVAVVATLDARVSLITSTNQGVVTYTVDGVCQQLLTDPHGRAGLITDKCQTIIPGPPATVAVSGGDAQSTLVHDAFDAPLVALVADVDGAPVPGATVTFTAPAAGASGTFTNGTRTTTAVTGSNGLATTSTLTANATVGGYSVTAAATAGSAAFPLTNIIRPPTKFVITSGAVSGIASATANLGPITVVSEDSWSLPVVAPAGGTVVNLASNSTGTKVFSATANGAAATSVTIPAGETSTTFYYGDTRSGTPLLTASGVLTSATQTETVVPAATVKLTFTANPSNSTGGIAFGTQPVVRVQDTFGNTETTSTAPVALALTTPGDATLTCTANPEAAVAGVTAFAGCRVDKVGTYTLTATSPGLTSAVSASFTITVGPADHLVFTTSPSRAHPHTLFDIQPVVALQDAGGNTVTTSGTIVTLTITPPFGGSILTCTANPMATVDGVATFTGCGINNDGEYTLDVNSPGLTAGVSVLFQ